MTVETPTIDALAGNILAGSAPTRLRLAAARGALPLPRATLVQIYVRLLADAEESVRTAAAASLGGLETTAVCEVLGDADCPREVLAHFAPLALRDAGLAELVVFHAATPTETLEMLAGSGGGAVAELLLTNEERLLAAPHVLNRLMANPVLRAAQRARILELLERVSRTVERGARGVRGATRGEALPPEAATLYTEAAELLAVDVGELLSESEILGGEELATHADVAIRTAYQRIITLNTAQKAILAMKGGREERLILIRDSNKCVALGVLKNPRLPDTEVEMIAKMRNVPEEVLRALGLRREWTKHYPVVAALVYNPRTPAAVSANLVNQLSNKDLRNLAASRESPEVLRRMARRIYGVRTQPHKLTLKKK